MNHSKSPLVFSQYDAMVINDRMINHLQLNRILIKLVKSQLGTVAWYMCMFLLVHQRPDCDKEPELAGST